MKKQRNVGILLFNYVDVLDYSGPFEVFSLSVKEASQVPLLLTKGIPYEEKPFIVKTISQNGELITTHNGLKILPDFSFHNVDQKFDIVIVPGGPLKAIKPCLKNPDLLSWISSYYHSGGMVASVCSGALLLAEAGLLSNKKATTNSFAIDYMRSTYSDIEVMQNVRFVDEGNVLTSAGVSAGIDMSLYIVGKLMGEDVARTTAVTMEYPYWKC